MTAEPLYRRGQPQRCPTRRGAPRASRAFALTELLVALALGLWLVGGAAALLLGMVRTQRQVLADVRLAQDARAALDVITRELRRARHHGLASPPLFNPHVALWLQGGSMQAIGFSYAAHAAGAGAGPAAAAAPRPDEFGGFRVHRERKVLEMRVRGGAAAPSEDDAWQPLTDPQAMHVVQLRFTPHVRLRHLPQACSNLASPCDAGDPPCELQHEVTVIDIELGVAEPHDPARVHTARSAVRLRNDAVTGGCPP